MSSDASTKGPQRAVQIGKYRVLAHLATGGMGAVYRAYDPAAKRDVALKVLTPEMASKPVMIERFRREAKHAGKLRHENVVELYEFGEADGCFYIAMEFVEGIDLAEYVDRKGVLDPKEALNLITQAARALDHAHRQGIVHRDVKPSNLLLTRKKGRLVLKLTDLGLSREVRDEDFRVTRAGTTVGTVDYISPEQARDSGAADIRSDLYSLGCTWHHLLTGKPPFGEGGLAERLHKHLTAEPPNPQRANPRVNEATAAVLRRLLAKRPVERHQTPAELLKDLRSLVGGAAPIGGRAALQGLMDGDEDPRPAGRTGPLSEAAPKPTRRPARPSAATGREGDAASPVSRAQLWYIVGGGAAVLLITAVAAVALLQQPERPPPATSNPDVPQSASATPPAAAPPPPAQRSPDQPPPGPPDKPHWPVLDPNAPPIDAAALRQEIEAPWAGQTPHPLDAPVYHIARSPHGDAAQTYATLAAAAAAAPAGAVGVLEIDDDGPLFETSTSFVDRRLIICAGKGFRPLVVWDVPRSVEERRLRGDEGRPAAFLTVERGGLRLENLDLAFTQPEAAAGGLVLLDTHDADLSADGCTFSLAGKPREPTVAARLRASGNGRGESVLLCRFTRCILRGPAMTALDVDAPGARLLIDHSLAAGGDAPLIEVRAEDARTTSLAVVRSTLVCGRTMLSIRGAADADRKPAVSWLGWDSLISRSGNDPVGDMVAAATGDGVSTTGMKWRAYNCLYAGWRNLLSGPEAVAGTDTIRWRAHWGRADGDIALRGAWPGFDQDTSVLPAAAYRTAGTEVAYAATADPDGPLGCDPSDLQPTRDNWPSLTTEPFLAPPLDPITDDAAPAVPGRAADNLYHGGRIDLSQPNFDLGAFLRDYQQKRYLAPRVVLLLSGAGEHPVTPFHLEGITLVLHAEAPQEDAAPVTLKWGGLDSVGQDGLIEIENGGLEMVNLNVKLADFPHAATPASLLKVRGDVRLFRCRLEGPQQAVSDPYQSLIALQGSGDPAPNAACRCAINESVLISGRDGVLVRGVGARLLLRQSVVLAGGYAFHFDPGPQWDGQTNALCALEHSTVAFRRAAVHLEDGVRKTDAPPHEPFVMRSRDCAFLDPFADNSGPSAAIAFEKSALAHGLLLWQGEGDVFGGRQPFAAAAPAVSGASAAPPTEGRAAWTRLWGSYGDHRPNTDVTLTKGLDAFPWALDRLALPKPKEPLPAERRAPGADLAQLGLLKKPAKPR